MAVTSCQPALEALVTLLSAGHTDDLVWYTIPLIEGASPRTRLAREGEPPVPDAVRLLGDVADALAARQID